VGSAIEALADHLKGTMNSLGRNEIVLRNVDRFGWIHLFHRRKKVSGIYSKDPSRLVDLIEENCPGAALDIANARAG
jgi:hypothetical protein